MKYCTNCRGYRESWVDKGYSGSNYTNRCYVCDKYTLSSSGDVQTTNAVNHLVKKAYEDTTRSVSTVINQDGNLRTGFKRNETLTLDKDTGDYHYEAYIEYPAKK